jgi:fibronectin-binding autotransporter adhesin
MYRWIITLAVTATLGMGASGQTLNQFNQNSALTAGLNYSQGTPTNTHDVRITTSISGLTISSSSVTMRSLSVTNGSTYTITNASSGGTNRTLTLGNTTSFTNLVSNVTNDLLYISGNSTFTFSPSNTGGGIATNSLVLASSGNFSVQSGSSLSVTSVISGGFGFTKTGTGDLTLANGNTYTGKTTISAGTVLIGGESAFGANPGAFTADQITLNGGTIFASSSLNFSSNRGITLGASGGTFNALNPTTISATNIISGTGSLTKTGSSNLTLNAANTYSGETLVSVGQVGLGNNLALQNSAINTAGAGTFTISVTTPTFGGLKGSKNLASVIFGSYSSVTSFTLNPGNGATNTYSGIIANGSMSLVKTGAGTQILSGANTYSGGTTISAGTLAIGAANSVPSAGGLTINGTGTFSSGATTGFSNNLGALTLNGTPTIALGSGAHTLTFSTLNNLGASLTINGWVGSTYTSGTEGQLIFTGLGSDPTVANLTFATLLGNITFTGFGQGTFISNGANLELVPVPEPTTILGLSAGVVMLGGWARRRLMA